MDGLPRVDFSLLALLQDLRQTRSVSETAERQGITQSGASRALARLRIIFDDPLFVVEAQRLEPTPRCDALAPRLARCLEAATELLAEPAFEPSSASGEVRVGMPDHLAFLFVPKLLRELSHSAPQVDLHVRHFSGDWSRTLREGEVDVAFGVLSKPEANLKRRWLHDDPWRVIVRRRHSVLRRPWGPESFAEGVHGLMTVSGRGASHVDRALQKLGLRRRVAFKATSPLVVAMVAAESDLKVTTTQRLAEALAARLPLVVLDLPLDADPLRLPLVWHERQHHDPRNRWLRSLLARVFAAREEVQAPGA